MEHFTVKLKHPSRGKLYKFNNQWLGSRKLRWDPFVSRISFTVIWENICYINYCMPHLVFQVWFLKAIKLMNTNMIYCALLLNCISIMETLPFLLSIGAYCHIYRLLVCWFVARSSYGLEALTEMTNITQDFHQLFWESFAIFLGLFSLFFNKLSLNCSAQDISL